MTAYDFIFSVRPRERIIRHVIFWIAWWLYFVITFLLPTFQFNGYKSLFHNYFIEKFGVISFIREILIFKSLIPLSYRRLLIHILLFLLVYPGTSITEKR